MYRTSAGLSLRASHSRELKDRLKTAGLLSGCELVVRCGPLFPATRSRAKWFPLSQSCSTAAILSVNLSLTDLAVVLATLWLQVSTCSHHAQAAPPPLLLPTKQISKAWLHVLPPPLSCTTAGSTPRAWLTHAASCQLRTEGRSACRAAAGSSAVSSFSYLGPLRRYPTAPSCSAGHGLLPQWCVPWMLRMPASVSGPLLLCYCPATLDLCHPQSFSLCAGI